MKKLFKYSLFVLAISVFSCQDATDIVQKDELNEEAAFQTVGDLQSGLIGVYDAYGPDFGGNGDGDAILWNDLFTDNFKRGDANQGQGSQEYNFILQPATTLANNIWSNRYGTINRINRVLNAYNRLYDGFSDEDKVAADQIKGQLLVMRALCHFDLFEYFTPDYDDQAGLAVIKMDFVPNPLDVFQRNTVAEIVEFVNADIEEAYTLLGTVNAGNVGFVNQNVAKALQARVAVVTGNNALALSLSDELVGDVALALPTAYAAMFQRAAGAGEAGELIFSLVRLPADTDIAQLYYFNNVSLVGNPFFEASLQFYNLFEVGDVRMDVNFDPETDPANDVILIGKYQGTAAAPLANDVPVFRSSEMQLIKAEALARQGDLAGAAAAVQALRVARYSSNVPTAPVFTSLSGALTEILLERRKELAFEGHRWLDLKRLGGELGIGVNRLASDAASFSAPASLSANDYRFTMPIPQDELSANGVITQNPGYPAN